jgi:7-carboxy-7-deazaguanine synthase
MKVAEIFNSIQGEGKWVGMPSVFVRTSGCNLRCSWCDTPYASWRPEGEDMEVEAIVDRAISLGAPHVVVTGGEPMIQPQLPLLIQSLRSRGRYVTVETAGTVWQDIEIDLASISPKLSNSRPPSDTPGGWAQMHESRRLNWEVLSKWASSPLIRDRQWKFVISQPADLMEVDSILHRLRISPGDVVLMPEGVDDRDLQHKAQWVSKLCQNKNFRFGTRLHVWLYGNRRGT